MATYPKYSSLWILVAADCFAWSSPLFIWVSCPGNVPSPLILHPHLSYLGDSIAWEAEKGLLWCGCCSATAKPQCVINIILVTQPKHCTLTDCYEQNSLQSSQTQHKEEKVDVPLCTTDRSIIFQGPGSLG